MKLTLGVNFTNILQAAFFYKSILCSFSLLAVWLCNFWQKNISAKAGCKMLMKLAKGSTIRSTRGPTRHNTALKMVYNSVVNLVTIICSSCQSPTQGGKLHKFLLVNQPVILTHRCLVNLHFLLC